MPSRRSRLSLIAVVFAFGLPLEGARASCGAPTDRPRVGLVLSGGGALGASHIGVLKVLEELRVPVDCIAGTSMGAIVGGLYATGLSAPQLERIIADIDWRAVFTDKPPRRDRDFRRKAEDESALLPYRIGVGEGASLPRGVVLGQQLDLALKALAFDAVAVTDFDRLAIPFRAVAADIESGEAVVLGDGDLAAAMRASMAVSGVFPPVDIGGRLLVDGGLVNNLPVDVARAMGADVVIVADIPSQLKARGDLDSAQAIIGQSISLMILRSSQLQIATLTEDDVLLSPDLSAYDATAFDAVLEMIPKGVAGARAQTDRLARLAVADAAYQAHVARRAAPPPPPTRIAALRIENNSDIADAVIASRIGVKPGDACDLPRIEEDLAEVYGLDYFETVSYRIENVDGGDADLVIAVQEKTIGLTTVRAGLNLQYDLSGGADFTVTGQVRFAGLDALGAEVLIDGAFGETNSIEATYLQPLDPATRYYVSAGVALSDQEAPQFANGDRLREIGVQEASATIAAARQVSTWGLAGLSFTYGAGRQNVRTGPPLDEDDGYRIAQVGGQLRYDTVDNVNFPSDGETLTVTATRNLKAVGAENDAYLLVGEATTTNSWGRNTIRGQLRGGAIFGDAAAREAYPLGGLFNLSAYAENELAGENFAYGGVIAYRNLGEEGPLFDLPLYLGAIVETATIWNDGEGRGRQRWSGGPFIGADTPLGPIYFGYAAGGAERHAVYLNLGRQF